MKIAVIGATGLVGREMLTVLAERGFGKEEIIAAASPKSVGKEIDFAGRRLTVVSVDDAIASHPQYAIFSAGAAASVSHAPWSALEQSIKERREADERAFQESVSPGEAAREKRETAVEEETFQLPPA